MSAVSKLTPECPQYRFVLETADRRQMASAGSVRSPHESRNQRDTEKNQKNKEQNLRDTGGCAGNAAEAQSTGDKRDHKKYECPTKHLKSPLMARRHFHS